MTPLLQGCRWHDVMAGSPELSPHAGAWSDRLCHQSLTAEDPWNSACTCALSSPTARVRSTSRSTSWSRYATWRATAASQPSRCRSTGCRIRRSGRSRSKCWRVSRRRPATCGCSPASCCCRCTTPCRWQRTSRRSTTSAGGGSHSGSASATARRSWGRSGRRDGTACRASPSRSRL